MYFSVHLSEYQWHFISLQPKYSFGHSRCPLQHQAALRHTPVQPPAGGLPSGAALPSRGAAWPLPSHPLWSVVGTAVEAPLSSCPPCSEPLWGTSHPFLPPSLHSQCTGPLHGCAVQTSARQVQSSPSGPLPNVNLQQGPPGQPAQKEAALGQEDHADLPKELQEPQPDGSTFTHVSAQRGQAAVLPAVLPCIAGWGGQRVAHPAREQWSALPLRPCGVQKHSHGPAHDPVWLRGARGGEHGQGEWLLVVSSLRLPLIWGPSASPTAAEGRRAL